MRVILKRLREATQPPNLTPHNPLERTNAAEGLRAHDVDELKQQNKKLPQNFVVSFFYISQGSADTL